MLSLFALIHVVQVGHAAQTIPVQATAAQDQSYVLHQNVQEVILNCTVLDREGHLVNDLQKQTFNVREGKAQLPIASFRHQDDPVSVGLVIDDSGSMKAKRDAVNATAVELLLASNPEDEAFVLNFADQIGLQSAVVLCCRRNHVSMHFIENKRFDSFRDAISRDPNRGAGVMSVGHTRPIPTYDCALA